MERRFQKKEYCQIYQPCFYLEELSQIQWSISKKQNNGRAYETKLEIKNIISITLLNLIQIQNLDLSEYLLIDYPNLKDFRLFILQYTKKKMIKNVKYGSFFFHWLEVEQIEKYFDRNYKI